MVGADDPDQPLLEQDLAGEDVGAAAEHADRQIDPAGLQVFRQGRVGGPQIDHHLRGFDPNAGDHPGQQNFADIGRG